MKQKARINLLLFVLLIHLFTAIGHAEDYNIGTYPQSYILEKLKSYDIVFLGTNHKKSSILRLLSDLIPYLHEAKVTHLGLEICSDQQERIDHFLQKGDGLMNIEIHSQIDCPEYRSMFKLIRTLDQKKRPRTVAIDLPRSMYKGETSRDKWMALSIAEMFHLYPNTKMLVVVGNLHVLKTIEWEDKVPNRHGFIRSYLNNFTPHLRIFSIGQCIDESPNECDFTKEFASVKGAVALECDSRFGGWKVGIMAPVAAKPIEACELLDGLIVY